MPKECPCCGRPWPRDKDELDRLLALLRAEPARQVYEAIDGLFYVSHTSCPVPRAVVQQAISRGLVVPAGERGGGDRDWAFKLPPEPPG
jgi:hypothetical protein